MTPTRTTQKPRLFGAELAAELVNAPMREWQATIDGLTRQERVSLDDAASDLAVQAARLADYVSARVGGKDHGKAVDQQNRTAAKVRKALGFAYPDQVITF